MRNKLLAALALFSMSAIAQENINKNKFRQLAPDWPTPNEYRTAAGAPGHNYYQNYADYIINVELDDEKQKLTGSEKITYTNNSPDQLEYLWVQLDQNMRALNSQSYDMRTGSLRDKVSFGEIHAMHPTFDGGFKIEYVKDARGNDLHYTINYTMMRINLDKPLAPGESFSFQVAWWYNINDRMKIGGRSGYEYFEKDDNYLYTIAQFFPRMAVYNDVEGWQNRQFLGRSEFALPFGDYKVSITVPADHIVASTGTLQNPNSVLTSEQRKRWDKAKRTYDKPVLIVNQEEATENEKEKSKDKKTWVFHADDVRDFAFATSRKFIWDAMAVKQERGKDVMAMSFYPKEGNPLWEQYSTPVVAHTLKAYSKYTFEYPYPVAISVHAARIGMEYPMICFNFGRPNEDGTYDERTKRGMIGVIIHEVGHNYFPMIVNSDEREWTWMDEGLNSFVQYLAEQSWEEGWDSRRGPAYKMTHYMGGPKDAQMPIMTHASSVFQFGNNAYGKPATALNVLRETVMGRELFDYAFKQYAQRWMFKHPTPSDFFRTMEDASGMDLDWFWRGWFYSTDHVDISIDEVKWFQPSSGDPLVEKEIERKNAERDQYISDIRNANKPTVTADDPRLQDFYYSYDPYAVDAQDLMDYDKYLKSLDEEDIALLQKGFNYYEIDFSNVGGLVMPIIVKFDFIDGTSKVMKLPAEIWAKNNEKVTKVFALEKEAVQITLDPYLETADTDRGNNFWPPRMIPTRMELYKRRSRGASENPMQRARRLEQMEK